VIKDVKMVMASKEQRKMVEPIANFL